MICFHLVILFLLLVGMAHMDSFSAQAKAYALQFLRAKREGDFAALVVQERLLATVNI